jgi:Uma2 family endonuclease
MLNDMSGAAKRRATYEDVLAAPEHVIAQVIDGVLYTMPRPRPRHSRVASRLGAMLIPPFDLGTTGPGGWVILDEPEVHLGHPEPDILVPDLAGWRRARMTAIPMEDAFITVVPDWICEVLSPSTQRIDRVLKMDVYAREGVGHAWILDPAERTLEVYRLERPRWLRVGAWQEEAVVRVEPFDAVEVPLAPLWEP